MKRIFFMIILLFTVCRAAPVFACNVSIKSSGEISEGYTMVFTNAYGSKQIEVGKDFGSLDVSLDEGDYEVSCEPSESGNILRVDHNRITVRENELLEICVSEAKAGYLYIRPDLMEGFKGSLDMQFKDTTTGSVYCCKINEYNYPYSTWNPMFYWKSMQLPCGSYEVIKCKVESRGHFLYTTVPEKIVNVYQSWSGMFFPSVHNIEISGEEAEKVYLDGEEYEETDSKKETKDKEKYKSERGISKILNIIILSVAVLICVVFGIVCLIIQKKKYKKR